MELYELWFRIVYLELIRERKITACLRPGDRRLPNAKGTTEGSLALIRILRRPGLDDLDIDPSFDQYSTTVKVTKIVVKRFGELTGVDLASCSPDCRSKEMARYHLGLTYNKVYQDDSLVSVVHFEYVD